MNLGVVLKKFCKDRKISQKNLSILLEISQTYLTLIQNEQRAVPVFFFEKVREVLQLTLDEQNLLLNAIKTHSQMNGNALQKAKIRHYWEKTIKIVTEVFNKVMISLDLNELVMRLEELKNFIEEIKNKLTNNYDMNGSLI